MNKHAAPNLKAEKIAGGVATDQRHDSAHKHVSGQAVYIDDMPEPAGTLHGCLGLSTVAHGTITTIDLSAVRAAPGVVDVLTAKDVPGENDICRPAAMTSRCLPTARSQFFGQPIFCVIAETREQARRACRLAKIEYEELPAIIDIGGLDPVKRQAGHAAADAEARRCRRGDRQGAAPAEGPDARRRPGSFLPRRPDRHGRARRGPGRHRLFLDAASERSAAHGRRMRWAFPRMPSRSRSGAWAAASAARKRRATSSRRWPRSPPRSTAAPSRSGPTATTT